VLLETQRRGEGGGKRKPGSRKGNISAGIVGGKREEGKGVGGNFATVLASGLILKDVGWGWPPLY
jgi:hypothetical protein